MSNGNQKWDQVVRGIERRTGLPVDKIRDMELSSIRTYMDERIGKPLSFISEFPTIGRGNVLRSSLIDTTTINREIDEILGSEYV